MPHGQQRPHPADVIARLGRETVTARELVAVSGRRRLDRALRSGEMARVARGVFSLPGVTDPRLAAHRLQGVVSHASAARLWGLDVLTRDAAPHVTLPRHRKLRQQGARVHWSDLAAHDVVDGLTSVARTVVDCARTMPFADALAVADSALRLRLVRPAGLMMAAEGLRGPGRRQVRRVIQASDGRAASAMESVLRATLLDARIVCFRPQLEIRDDRFLARVDLGDALHRIALEADSFEHHGSRAALLRDCHRYDELSVRGWLVLRFAWEHVMFERAWVAEMVVAALRERSPLARRRLVVTERDR
jgi:very-short-patch-repair endonuclease